MNERIVMDVGRTLEIVNALRVLKGLPNETKLEKLGQLRLDDFLKSCKQIGIGLTFSLLGPENAVETKNNIACKGENLTKEAKRNNNMHKALTGEEVDKRIEQLNFKLKEQQKNEQSTKS